MINKAACGTMLLPLVISMVTVAQVSQMWTRMALQMTDSIILLSPRTGILGSLLN
jgi:L-lactate permease